MIMALLVAACSDPTGPDGSSGRRLGQLSKDPFVGAVGAVVEAGIVVKDSNMRPVKGESVLWEIAEGRGELLEASTSTNSDGEAWTTIRLDTIAGQLEVIGRLASDQSKSVRVSVIAEPGPAVRVRESSDTVYIMFKQATLMPGVFEDRYGNAITGGRTKWSFAEPQSIEVQGDSAIGLRKGAFAATASLDGFTTEVVVEVVYWTAVSVGTEHTCGLLSNGRAYCWGSNHRGQLGLEDSPEMCSNDSNNIVRPCSKVPVPVDTDLRFENIWASGFITCGAAENGSTYCWGHNYHGALGIGVPEEDINNAIPTPTKVAIEENFREITANSFFSTCGLTVSGAVYCWGGNVGSTYGDGKWHAESFSAVPVRANGGPWTGVIIGDAETCALDLVGQLYCWGARYYKSEGNTASSGGVYLEPTPFPEGYRFQSIARTRSSTCGITTDGDTYCWGHNAYGELGLGYTDGTHVEPTEPVLGGHRFTQITGGSSRFCGLTAQGKAYCWGWNQALGFPYDESKVVVCGEDKVRCVPQPVPVNTTETFSQIGMGHYHTCALSNEGMAYCWGWSNYGQVGINDESAAEPVPVVNPLANES